MSRRRIARMGSLLVAAALVGPTAPAAAAPTVEDVAAAAAHWTTGRLTDGVRVYDEEFAFDDVGLTIDVLLALAATGTGAGTITAVADWVEGQAATYTGAAEGATYVGATAKAIVAAVATGRDPRAFGGLDLVERLATREGPDGRLTDASTFGDYSSTISQALAVVALERAGVGASDAAVAYLAGRACADGGLRLELDADGCTSDVDATAFAVDALLLDGSQVAVVGAAVNWLEDVQGADGGFSSSEGVPNANSTGLAAMALRRAGAELAADRAVAWLIGLAQGCDAADVGAIAADPDAGGDALRATPQAVLGLTGVGPATVDATGAATSTRPLDCTPEEAQDAPADPSSPAAADAPTSGDYAAGAPPLLVIAVVVVALVTVGVVLARRRPTP